MLPLRTPVIPIVPLQWYDREELPLEFRFEVGDGVHVQEVRSVDGGLRAVLYIGLLNQDPAWPLEQRDSLVGGNGL